MTKIKDIPKIDRPREKFLEKGPDALSKSDLLAILLGSGIKGINVQELAKQVIKKLNKDFLSVTVEDLLKVQGIGKAKALQITAAISLVKRFYKEGDNNEIIVKNSRDVASIVYDLKDKKKEHLVCLYLNARNSLLKKEIISVGLLDKSLFHPREMFAPALELRAASVIVVHNHPSGYPEPSEKDTEIAQKIAESGKLLGISVLDFLIIAKNGIHSFLDNLKNKEDTDYVADNGQMTFFDLLVDAKSMYQYEKKKTGKSKEKASSKKDVKIIDLFAGIGGFHLAFHNVGAECVFASEWDEAAQNTYRRNLYNVSPELFDSGNFVGDITKIDPKTISDFDVLCAGFPCQPFSQAGFKKGFEETRGTLFFDIVRIIKKKKPEAFFLENVRHLLNHNDGKTFATIKKVMENDLGYSFFSKVVKASDFGLPQHRPRLFMVGFKDKAIDFEFPKPIPLKCTMSDVFGGKCDKRIGFTLRVGGRGSKIKDRRNWDSYRVDGKIRRLGKKEGLKMQGFPDSFEFRVSETQAMKQLGNSVAIPAIQAVAEEIIKRIKEHGKKK